MRARKGCGQYVESWSVLEVQALPADEEAEMRNPICWWFGCDPDYLAGKYWLWRKWWPAKCDDCGKRYGRHDGCDDIPF